VREDDRRIGERTAPVARVVAAAAQTFRPNPKLNTAQIIMELGKGEALVSFLEGNGTPAMVERIMVRPPSARIGPITPEERKAIIAISDGWLLFRPNDNLARPLKCHGVPTGPTIAVDPSPDRATA